MRAFSLVEMLVSLSIFALLALALTKSLTYSKYLAEDNLYEATSLTTVSSIIEQIKGASIDLIIHPEQTDGKDSFEMLADGVTSRYLILDEYNNLDVPVVTDTDGNNTKTIIVRVRPSITEMTNGQGFWIEVKYEFDHLRTGRTQTNIVRNARSKVPSA